MSSCPSPCKDDIRTHAMSLGAAACGFARAGRVSDVAIDIYDRWIADGHHGTMQYCEKYREQRNDPRLLLDGAQTVVSCAFDYYNEAIDAPMAHRIARYAWGNDYHWVVKDRLRQLGEYIVETYGGEYRVCVDTAPIRERYWAMQAGIGFVGINNQCIVPGHGSYCFLGEVLWTGAVDPDAPCTESCGSCYRCVSACPGRALDGKGGCDARRCLSYLTIEHRGDRPDGIGLGGVLYGCDRCQEVCPHNRGRVVTQIPEFKPDMAILTLTPEEIRGMTNSHYRRLTRKSAMSRVTLTRLKDNL